MVGRVGAFRAKDAKPRSTSVGTAVGQGRRKVPVTCLKFFGSRGSMVAKLKLKGIDGRAPPGVEPAA